MDNNYHLSFVLFLWQLCAIVLHTFGVQAPWVCASGLSESVGHDSADPDFDDSLALHPKQNLRVQAQEGKILTRAFVCC